MYTVETSSVFQYQWIRDDCRSHSLQQANPEHRVWRVRAQCTVTAEPDTAV